MKTTKQRHQEISDAIVAAADRIHLLGRTAMGAGTALAQLTGSLSAISEVVSVPAAEQLLRAVDRAIPQSAIRDPQSPTTGAQQ